MCMMHLEIKDDGTPYRGTFRVSIIASMAIGERNVFYTNASSGKLFQIVTCETMKTIESTRGPEL